MNNRLIEEGDIFNRLTVLREVGRKNKDKRRFLCKCICGNLKEINLIHLTTNTIKSCGCATKQWFHEHKREKNPNWKGGRRIESSGYIEIYKPEHPQSRQTGYIKEHRVIMEKELGRLLLPEENVHHRDGNKQNNNIGNLELWNTSQPSGQRVIDKLSWARRIIKLYG